MPRPTGCHWGQLGPLFLEHRLLMLLASLVLLQCVLTGVCAREGGNFSAVEKKGLGSFPSIWQQTSHPMPKPPHNPLFPVTEIHGCSSLERATPLSIRTLTVAWLNEALYGSVPAASGAFSSPRHCSALDALPCRRPYDPATAETVEICVSRGHVFPTMDQ